MSTKDQPQGGTPGTTDAERSATEASRERAAIGQETVREDDRRIDGALPPEPGTSREGATPHVEAGGDPLSEAADEHPQPDG